MSASSADAAGGTTLVAEAAVVRAAIGSRRSDKILRLFDFLVERTLADRPPSEIEIANAVFSIGRVVDSPQDATVRVNVHRLRKALDAVYAGRTGGRLLIPKGEYRITLSDEDPEAGAPAAEPTVTVAARRPFPWKVLGLALLLLVGCNVAMLGYMWSRSDLERPSALSATALWEPVARGTRPIAIILGDYYLFAEPTGGAGAPLLVRYPSVNRREELELYLMAHPGETKRDVDMNLHYVPSGAVLGIDAIFRAMRGIRGARAAQPMLLPASQLTPEMLKTHDLVYVGQLSGLGMFLRNPLFQASGFRVGGSYDELIDSSTGRVFRSQGGAIQPDEHMARQDYGYIARFPGPTGNTIVVVAGMRDPALLQMADMVADPARLRTLSRSIPRRAGGLEALFRVRNIGNENIGGNLVLERALRTGGIWDQAKASQTFPDDRNEGVIQASH